jgi:hypothetical protein
MPPYVPSIATLEANDDGRLTAELRLARLRTQVALVRTLADEIERLSLERQVDGLGEQLVEETARLGCRLLEVASGMTEVPRPGDSGVFERRG